MNVRIPPATQESAAWMLSARHWRGPCMARRIAYCTAIGIASPNHTQIGQKSPNPVAAQITTITKTISAGDAELHRLHSAPVDLAPRLVHACTAFSMVSSIAPERRVHPWGAMASDAGAVPTATAPPMPATIAAAPPSRKPPSSSAPARRSIWTDGACSGNPGPGGWAAIVIAADGGEPVELSGGERARRRTTGWS